MPHACDRSAAFDFSTVDIPLKKYIYMTVTLACKPIMYSSLRKLAEGWLSSTPHNVSGNAQNMQKGKESCVMGLRMGFGGESSGWYFVLGQTA